MLWSRIFLLICCVVALAGAAPAEPLSRLQRWVARGFHVTLDKEFTLGQRQRVLKDLSELKLRGVRAEAGSTFEKVFGGRTSSELVRFFNERVSLLLPPGVGIRERVEPTQAMASGVVSIGTNVGASFWLQSVASGAPSFILLRDGKGRKVPVDSTRVGIVQLAPGYFGQGAAPTSLARTAALVHEARHSDCTGGLSAADIARMRDRSLRREERYPENRACGHLHSICGIEHPYAGLMACDSHPWGAYAIEAVYASELARSCRACSEEQRQVAGMIALDSLSRVREGGKMMRGEFGDPDMSSLGILQGEAK